MMRLRRLDLNFFGHFSNKKFDFGVRPEKGPDFHLIYGLNEAGKTTIMEGYLRFLYGFKPREPYAFQHQQKNLSVSALLELNGKDVFYTRRSARPNSLFDNRGDAAPETALKTMLADLAQDDYRKLLCLDDATLERGGEEIINSKGEIGRLLFSAAAGISNLSSVLDSVKIKAAELYRKSGKKTKFATLKNELNEVKNQIKKLDVSVLAYRTLKRSLDTALDKERQADEQRQGLYKTNAKLKILAQVLPMLIQANILAEKLSPLSHYPKRLDIDPESLVRMLTDQNRLQSDETRQRHKIDSLNKQVDSIKRDPTRLDLANDLEPLEGSCSRFITAKSDLPKRQDNLREILSDMRRSAENLGLGDDIHPCLLVLSLAKLTELDKSHEGLNRARENVETEKQELEDLAGTITEIKAKVADLVSRMPPHKSILSIWEQFNVDALSQSHAVATNALRTAKGSAQRALSKISVRDCKFEVVPVVRMTAVEADGLSRELHGLANKQENLQAQKDEIKTKQTICADKIRALKENEGIITDAEANAERTRRDNLWLAHTSAMTLETATVFENTMRQVDRMADRRLAHAQTLGQLRQIEQELAGHHARAEKIEDKLWHNASHIKQLESQVEEISTVVGLSPPLTHAGLVEWLRDLESARSTEADIEVLEEEHSPTFAKAVRISADLVRIMDLKGGTLDFAAVVERASRRKDDYRNYSQNVQNVQNRLADLFQTKQQREFKLEAVIKKKSQAETAWKKLVSRLFKIDVDPNILHSSLEPIRKIREAGLRCQELKQRIEAMNTDQKAFREGVKNVASRYKVDIDEGDPSDVFTKLKSIGQNAQNAESQYKDLKKREDVTTKALGETRAGLQEIADRRTSIGSYFAPSIPTDSLENLRDSVSQAHGVIRERKQLGDLEQEIVSLLEVPDMDSARDALADTKLAELQAQLSKIAEDIELAEDSYKKAIETRTTAKSHLHTVTGDADVAVLVERGKTLELEMQEVAITYLEIQLGYHLADEAIRRYRDKHRSGMLEETERAFAELTQNTYKHLQAQADRDSEVLVAIDKHGKAKRAADMSKSTRFQLYLALRAAAYEQMASYGTILPFFCDDIFETFDENRTRAACALMGRIGQTGQAIYLTHHKHVVDIAQKVCGQGVQIHNI